MAFVGCASGGGSCYCGDGRHFWTKARARGITRSNRYMAEPGHVVQFVGRVNAADHTYSGPSNRE